MAGAKPRDGARAAPYGAHLARGPMGGDQYTQIHNGVFRDRRLSAKAMGVFGHCSTHQEGWRLTVRSIAGAMKDGVDAITGALQELERHAYLIRYRVRHANGQLGDAVYFFTDLPAQLLDLELPDDAVKERVHRAFRRWLRQNGWSEPLPENPAQGATSDDDPDAPPVDKPADQGRHRRSGPVPGNPDQAEPDQAEPDQADPATKNPNHQNTREEQQTGATLAPDPQRPEDGTAMPPRRPEVDLAAELAGTGVLEGDHQTARTRYEVSPRSEVVDDLGLLVSLAAPRAINHQQAVTRAYRLLVDATTGAPFRQAVHEYLLEHPDLEVRQAQDEVHGILVREVLLTAAANADAAITSRRAAKGPGSPQNAPTPPTRGDHPQGEGVDEQRGAGHTARIRAKYGTAEGAGLAVAG